MFDKENIPVNSTFHERRSRDTRPLPARRNAAPCKAAQP
jgi:hypothetical protein